MLPPDHPLAELQARAALATGWPTLHLAAPTEGPLLRALQALEALLGPLPQAELIEPSEPGEPARLRVDLPGLTAASWRTIRDATAGLGLAAALAPADPPGTREAKDQLALVPDAIEPEGGISSTMTSDPTAAPPSLAQAATEAADAAPPSRPQAATDAAHADPPSRAQAATDAADAAPPSHAQAATDAAHADPPGKAQAATDAAHAAPPGHAEDVTDTAHAARPSDAQTATDAADTAPRRPLASPPTEPANARAGVGAATDTAHAAPPSHAQAATDAADAAARRPLASPPTEPANARAGVDAATATDTAHAPPSAAASAPSPTLPAVLWASPEGDGLWLPDLTEEPADPQGGPLASEIVAAIGAIAPELRLPPHRLVAFVRHRPTGRRGIRVALPASLLDPLPGAALAALRRAVVGAVAQVVARRADSSEALAPDLSWDPRFGFALTVWRVGPPGAALPADAPLTVPLEPPPPALAAAIRGQHGRVGAFEVQVLPDPPTAHDAVALALAETLQGHPLAGGPSRWLGAPTPVFCPTWRFDPEDLDAVLPAVAALPDRADVARVRVVPVDPIGLEHRAPFVDPAWRQLGGRWFVRWRDGGLDRDALPVARDRDRDAADRADLAALTSALQRVPGLTAENAPRPIVDSADRPGLAIRLPVTTPDWALSWVLGALAAAASSEISTVADLALPPGGPTILLWRVGTEERAPLWGYTG